MSHETGEILGTRQGSRVVRQSVKVSSNTSTTATKVFRVKASSTEPVVVEAQVSVVTADGGTTPAVSIGTNSATYDNIVDSASTATGTATGTFLPASNALGKVMLFEDTDLYYIQEGTPDGAGVYYLLIDITDVNTTSLS